MSDALTTGRDDADALFRDVVETLVSESSVSAVYPISLVALMDDGELKTVAVLGNRPDLQVSRELWSDEAWSVLVRDPAALTSSRLVTSDSGSLLPITVGSVLYGAVEWHQPLAHESLSPDALACAAQLLAPTLVAAVQQ